MQILNLDAVGKAPAFNDPYRHFVGDGVLTQDAVPALVADFPDIKQTGFFPLDDLRFGGAFAALMDDIAQPAFSEAVGAKLDMALADKPKLITIRKWSATSDGRIHTDSLSKIATTLIYLNERWQDDGAGRLRVLRGPKDFNDYDKEISPTVGSMFGFRRAENSWHGHLPFAGERKVVQITWLIDDSKVAHKQRTAKFTRLLKRLNPFSK
jgi:SM-20-related protein